MSTHFFQVTSTQASENEVSRRTFRRVRRSRKLTSFVAHRTCLVKFWEELRRHPSEEVETWHAYFSSKSFLSTLFRTKCQKSLN